MKVQHRIKIYGIVQGIGFRPFVKRLADECHIGGDVRNRGAYVEIHAAGNDQDVRVFEERIRQEAPPAAAFVRFDVQEISFMENDHFAILQSIQEAGPRFVSPDLAICSDCEQEMQDVRNRRYLHPFINCTNCGPRLTIIEELPYDRIRTSMRDFPMCPRCKAEYQAPSNRRFHAQPICCRDDGPHLWTVAGCADVTEAEEKSGILQGMKAEAEPKGDQATMRAVREVIRRGGIAAVKGIGGFHLVCDAKNDAAVRRLRRLKHRPAKPFALMMKDVKTARRYCSISPREEEILTGSAKPILLLEKREAVQDISASAAPEQPQLGVLLPYTPLHRLLFFAPEETKLPEVLIMTSGNGSGAPICRTNEEALRDLSPLCDVILLHNREIRMRADDSVMRLVDDRPFMIRLSRGYAPLPLTAGEREEAPLLAVGGELKNAFVLSRDGLYYPSAYIGNLGDERSLEALKMAVSGMERLLAIKPSAIVCDLHPAYTSSAFAKDYAKKHELRLLEVQHHFAHVRACTAEHDCWDEEVIGVAFDGTGFGTDRTIWGGEFLLAKPDSFVRVGSLEPFFLAGGDAAAKEGWRAAVDLLRGIYGEDSPVFEHLRLCDKEKRSGILAMLRYHFNTIETTSAGRLFDAVAAILQLRQASSFEGEASCALEYAAERYERRQVGCISNGISIELNPWTQEDEGQSAGMGYSRRSFVISVRNILKAAVEAALTGEKAKAEEAAFAFHLYMAEAVAAGCNVCRKKSGIGKVALSGGVFQNRLLTRLCREALEREGFIVLTHSRIPANDGGIAFGQAAAAQQYIRAERE